MEEYTYAPEAAPSSPASCAQCGSPQVERGHATQLCSECRQAFINYPIPRWLWIFAGVVAMVLIINVLKLPASINLASHLIRAERAIEAHNYKTAQQEADLVLKEFPEHFEASCYRLIAAAYNFDMAEYEKSMAHLANKSYLEEALVVQCNAATDYLGRQICNDTLLLEQLNLVAEKPYPEQLHFFDSVANSQQTQTNVSACGVILGNILLDKEQLPESITLLKKALEANPDNYSATTVYATALRKSDQLERADSVIDALLEHNHQDAYALSVKARITMRMKQYAAAEDLAREAIRLNPLSDHALASLALVLHASGKKAAGRELVAAVEKLSANGGDTTTASHLRQVLDGEIVYR